MHVKDKLHSLIRIDSQEPMQDRVKHPRLIKTGSQELTPDKDKLRLHIKTDSLERMQDKVEHQLLGGITHYLNNGLEPQLQVNFCN